jgi:spore coat polysaccharide biosynthesis protein SpsF (cytidylyltransferase family)
MDVIGVGQPVYSGAKISANHNQDFDALTRQSVDVIDDHLILACIVNRARRAQDLNSIIVATRVADKVILRVARESGVEIFAETKKRANQILASSH